VLLLSLLAMVWLARKLWAAGHPAPAPA